MANSTNADDGRTVYEMSPRELEPGDVFELPEWHGDYEHGDRETGVWVEVLDKTALKYNVVISYSINGEYQGHFQSHDSNTVRVRPNDPERFPDYYREDFYEE